MKDLLAQIRKGFKVEEFSFFIVKALKVYFWWRKTKQE